MIERPARHRPLTRANERHDTIQELRFGIEERGLFSLENLRKLGALKQNEQERARMLFRESNCINRRKIAFHVLSFIIGKAVEQLSHLCITINNYV